METFFEALIVFGVACIVTGLFMLWLEWRK